MTLDKGLSGLPGQPPVYAVSCHIFSDSMDIFLSAFPKHVEALEADVPYFTDIRSAVQISEVVTPGIRYWQVWLCVPD
ncbi:EthD family reductase [Niastella koreensis]|uniref:EthD family reductase n=1 Tax=Niastella koreensis TaxID=354356 RepID=UPI0037435788